MRSHVEGVRLDKCDKLKYALRASERLFKDLVEAIDRIPPSISGRQFVEHGLTLSRGILALLEELFRDECSGYGSPSEINNF